MPLKSAIPFIHSGVDRALHSVLQISQQESLKATLYLQTFYITVIKYLNLKGLLKLWT